GGKPLPHRIRAITACRGDEVLGVGGLGYRPDGIVIAFAMMTDEMRKYPRAVHRSGVLGMMLIRDSGVRQVFAEAEIGNEAAAPWLLHFGFRERTGAPGARPVYEWQRDWPADVE